jgi:hypothetical protein
MKIEIAGQFLKFCSIEFNENLPVLGLFHADGQSDFDRPYIKINIRLSCVA